MCYAGLPLPAYVVRCCAVLMVSSLGVSVAAVRCPGAPCCFGLCCVVLPCIMRGAELHWVELLVSCCPVPCCALSGLPVRFIPCSLALPCGVLFLWVLCGSVVCCAMCFGAVF